MGRSTYGLLCAALASLIPALAGQEVIAAQAQAQTAGRTRPPSHALNVVLVHGFWNTGAIFDPLVARLEKQGCRCFAPSLRPNDFRDGVRAETLRLRTAVDEHFGERVPVVFVCFSMGGLAVRDYVENLGGALRTQAIFFISTGHHGSLWAALSPEVGKRDLVPGSAFLRELDDHADALAGIPVHDYWTPYDLVVLPSTSTRWPYDASVSTRVPCAFHPWMVHDPRVLADITARIAALPRKERSTACAE